MKFYQNNTGSILTAVGIYGINKNWDSAFSRADSVFIDVSRRNTLKKKVKGSKPL